MKRRSDCPISCTLDLLGDKWSLLILRDAIIHGKKNFSDFQNSKEGISTNILTDRLLKLTGNGIFTKLRNSNNQLKFDYELTPKGRELANVVFQLASWGQRHFDDTEDTIAMMMVRQ